VVFGESRGDDPSFSPLPASLKLLRRGFSAYPGDAPIAGGGPGGVGGFCGEDIPGSVGALDEPGNLRLRRATEGAPTICGASDSGEFMEEMLCTN
jgi:hypothetical protein